MVVEGCISQADLGLLQIVDSATDAAQIILKHYAEIKRVEAG